MKKLLFWVVMASFIFSSGIGLAADKGLHLKGLEKDVKKAKIEEKKSSQQTDKEAEKAKKKAKKEAEKRKKELEKKKKKAQREAENRMKEKDKKAKNNNAGYRR